MLVDDFEAYWPGSYSTIGPWEALPWSGTGAATVEVATGPNPNPPGLNVLDLEGDTNLDGYVKLMGGYGLEPGKIYSVAFSLGGSGEPTEPSERVTVFLGSSSGGASWTDSYTVDATESYKRYLATFTPTTPGDLVLWFHNPGTDNTGAFLDDVQIDCNAPSTYVPPCPLGTTGCPPCDASGFVASVLSLNPNAPSCQACTTLVGSLACGECDYATGNPMANTLPNVPATTNPPPGVIEFTSDASIFNSPYYSGGLGNSLSPAVIRIPGCLTAFVHVSGLTIQAEFQGLDFWDTYNHIGIQLPAECLEEDALMCIHDLYGGKAVLTDVRLQPGMRLLNAVNANVEIRQTPGKGLAQDAPTPPDEVTETASQNVIRGGTIGSIHQGADVTLSGVIWNGFDATTHVRSGRLNIVGSEINAPSSWCRSDQIVLVEDQAVFSPSRQPFTASSDLDVIMVSATEQAHVNVVASRLGGAFVAMRMYESELQMVNNEFGCSAWAVSALNSTVMAISNDFEDLAVPYHLVGSSAGKSLVTDVSQETPGGTVGTTSTTPHSFFSLCDSFFATFPAVVASDNPVSIYGSNFRTGHPVQAKYAIHEAPLYGGLHNIVPVPDNVQFVRAVHEPSGVVKGYCAPICFGTGNVEVCLPCGMQGVAGTCGDTACHPIEGTAANVSPCSGPDQCNLNVAAGTVTVVDTNLCTCYQQATVLVIGIDYRHCGCEGITITAGSATVFDEDAHDCSGCVYDGEGFPCSLEPCRHLGTTTIVGIVGIADCGECWYGDICDPCMIQITTPIGPFYVNKCMVGLCSLPVIGGPPGYCQSPTSPSPNPSPEQPESAQPMSPIASCGLPTYCLLDGAGNHRKWSLTGTDVFGIVNLPLVAPDLTSVHYLLALPDSLSTELQFDGVTMGFYNFAAKGPGLSPPPGIPGWLSDNVGDFVPGTASGGYGFAITFRIPVTGYLGNNFIATNEATVSCTLLNETMAGFDCPDPTQPLFDRDVVYYYQEDSFPQLVSGIGAVRSFMGCITGHIFVPNSKLTVKLVSERSSTNCGVTGDGTDGVSHTFSEGTIAVNIQFHDRESRRSTFDLVTRTENNDVTAKIGLSQKAASGTFAYVGGSLEHTEVDAQFTAINEGTHTISLTGKTEEKATLTYTPDAFTDPGPVGGVGMVGAITGFLVAAPGPSLAFLAAGEGGIGEVDVQIYTADDATADSSRTELTLTELRSKQTINVHHKETDVAVNPGPDKQPEFSVTLNSPQVQNQDIYLSMEYSPKNPGPIVVSGTLKRINEFDLSAAGTLGDAKSVTLDVQGGWVENLSASVPFDKGILTANLDVISNFRVDWAESKAFSFSTPAYTEAYPAPRTITVGAVFTDNEFHGLYSGILGHSTVGMDQKEHTSTFTGYAYQQGNQNLTILFKSAAHVVSLPPFVEVTPALEVDIQGIEFVPSSDGYIEWTANLEFQPKQADSVLEIMQVKDPGDTLAKATIDVTKGAIGNWTIKVTKGSTVDIDGNGRGIQYLQFVPGKDTLKAEIHTPDEPNFYAGPAPYAILEINNAATTLDLKFLNITGPGTLSIANTKDPEDTGQTGCQAANIKANLRLEAMGATGAWSISKSSEQSTIKAGPGFFRLLDLDLDCNQYLRSNYLLSLESTDVETTIYAPLLSAYFPMDVHSTVNINIQKEGRWTKLDALGVNAVTLCADGVCKGDFKGLNMDLDGTLSLRTEVPGIGGNILAVLEASKSQRTMRCHDANGANPYNYPNTIGYRWDFWVLSDDYGEAMWEGRSGDGDHYGDTTLADTDPMTYHSGGGPERPTGEELPRRTCD